MSSRRAVIDIGTNSIKLMVADVSSHRVRAVCEEKEQTRLGKDFYETHRLQAEAIHATAYFAAKFAGIARENGAEHICVIATSATRDATNQGELLQAIHEKAGLRVEVLSGEEEARLAFLGVGTDPKLENQRICIVEVGGGSAQFIVGESDHMEFARSYPLGGVRLLERFPVSNPPTTEERRRFWQWLGEFIMTEVQPALSPVLARERNRTALVGVGSTAKGLLRMESKLNEEQRHKLKWEGIPLATVSDWTTDLWEMSLSDRKRLIGMDKKRADTIPFGAAIMETVMRQFHFTHLRVSKRGIRHGALKSVGAE